MTIIDTHAHIYPDAIALKAAASIGKFYDIPMDLDGTVDTLLRHGDQAGIDRFLVQSVAVTWERAHSINDFIARSVNEHPDRFVGFGAMHPDHPEMEKELDRILSLGLKGVKLHPDFQHFCLDDPNAVKLFEAMAERNLALLVHTGDKRYPYSQPERMARALDRVPRLRAICAHLGGWSRMERCVEDSGRTGKRVGGYLFQPVCPVTGGGCEGHPSLRRRPGVLWH